MSGFRGVRVLLSTGNRLRVGAHPAFLSVGCGALMAKAKDRLILKREYSGSDVVNAIGEHMARSVRGTNAERLGAAGKYRIEVHFTRSPHAGGTVAIANLFIPEEAVDA